jgi:hypothetical protein
MSEADAGACAMPARLDELLRALAPRSSTANPEPESHLRGTRMVLPARFFFVKWRGICAPFLLAPIDFCRQLAS